MFKTLAAITAVALLGAAPLTANTASAQVIRHGGHMGGNFSRGFGAGGFASHSFMGHAFAGRGLNFGHFAGAFGGRGVWRRSAGRYGTNLAPHGAMAAVTPGANWRGQQGFDHSHGWFAGREFQRGNVGWAGPVFWPYAYNDLYDYAFDPYYDGLDGGLFWAYGYDDLFAGVLLPYVAGAIANGVGVAPNASSAPAPAATTGAGPASSSVAACASNQSIAGGVSIDDIRNAVHPTADQSAKLDALKTAEGDSEKTLADACAGQIPATAEARLDAVDGRLQTMDKALDQVRGPLDDFYSSLSDEQKAAFNAIGDKRKTATQTPTQTVAAAPSLAQLCGPQNAVPVLATSQIDRAITPDAKQQQSLAALSEAANKADQTILASCPAQAPLTPTGRLDAVQGRLQAMLKGVDMVKPALHDFYASLSDPQKSRFDALTEPPAAAQNSANAHT
jgi:hypothetical protein